MNIISVQALLCILFFCIASNVNAQNSSSKEERFERSNEAPDSITGELERINKTRQTITADDLVERIFRPWFKLSDNLYENYGLNLGFTYSLLYQHASKSLPGREKDASSGIVDFFGEWHLLNKGKTNSGTLGFRVKGTHNFFTDITPNSLGNEIGSLWRTATTFSNQDLFITQLWWTQFLWDDKIKFRIGKVDQSDFVDFFSFSSDKLYFSNAAFSLNPTIPFPDNGLGGFVKFLPGDFFYVLLSLGDNNAKSDSFNFESFFDKREYFTAVEINFNPLSKKYGHDGNHHVTFWHSDGKAEEGTPSSKGFSINLDEVFNDKYGAFIRYSYSDGNQTDVKQLFSMGFGFTNIPLIGKDIFALAFAVGEPRQNNLRTQYVLESFYRIQLFSVLQVTPDIQFIINPSNNPKQDLIVVYGLRLRVAI